MPAQDPDLARIVANRAKLADSIIEQSNSVESEEWDYPAWN